MSFLSTPTIALAGGTGDLGTRLTNAFLEIPELRTQFSKIIVISRKRSEKTDQWQARGVEIRILQGETEEACRRSLDGVDILINAIGAKGDALRTTFLYSIPDTDVKLYFLSEFGVDYRLHDFPMSEWDSKRRNIQAARDFFPKGNPTTAIRIFMGLFLHDGIGPAYGLDARQNKFSVIGDVDSHVSYTEIADVARVIGILIERYAKDGPNSIPETLTVAGCTKTIREIARVMEQTQSSDESGDTNRIEFEIIDGPSFKAETVDNKSTDALRYLRFLMGDGSIDHRLKDVGGHGNDNESVNPGESLFKWKTIEDLAKETKGRP